jgi:chemotaxis protein CheC
VVRLQILGEARGDLLLVFPKSSADRLLTRLMPTMALDSPLREEMSQSALREVGNIIASTFLSAIGNHLGTTLVPSVPLLNRLRARDFREELLNNLKSSDERCVIVEAEFSGSDDQIAGQFFLLPHLDTIERLLTTACSVEPAGNSV